jgi:phage tail sheath protein FI
MSFFHGVTVTLVDSGPRPISIPSSSIIGLVDSYTPGDGLVDPNVPTLVTSQVEAVNSFGVDSAIAKATQNIFNQSSALVVVVGVAYSATPSTLQSNVIGGVDGSGVRTGLSALLDAKSVLNLQPRIIVAPGHSAIQAVATAMDVVAGKLRAVAIIDGPNSSDSAATAYAALFGSKRLFMVDPGVRVYDTTSGTDVARAASPVVAGLIAQTDANFGFWWSPSNKEMVGITGTGRPVEFLHGDASCRANVLNNANVATIIREGGYRLWGNRTLSSDAKWQFITRVRTLDMVMDAILYGHLWAVDRAITKTYIKDVTEGLQAFMRDLKAQGALIDFEVYPDPDLNSASQLEQGKVYWNIRFTDVPPAENPIFRVEITNQWLTEVLDITG